MRHETNSSSGMLLGMAAGAALGLSLIHIFGVAVQGAPPFAQLGFQLFCSAEQFFRCDHFKINSLLFYKENPLGHWP